MSREVYTYANLKQLGNNRGFREICRYPIISVSADMRKSLKGSAHYDHVDGMFKDDSQVMVTEFRSLANAVNGEWTSDQCKFNELIYLSEYVRGKMTAAGDKNEMNWLSGCMKNLQSMLSAIILLVQAKVSPDEISISDDRNIELLVGAWKYLIEKDKTLNRYETRMESLTTKEKWGSILRQAFKVQYSFETAEAIVFHDFYYITPFQEWIMTLMEKAGYRLIYLIPYDERYPFVHEIWDRTYSNELGFPGKDKWHIEKTEAADPYGDMFEGKTGISKPNELNIREYASVMEFVDDIKPIKKAGYMVYSADHKSANKILREYYPEEYGERKMLSFPVGQFINTIDQMWDDEKQTIAFDEENLIECFSSGWLSVNGVSGKQYLKQLIYILPFFGGCHTINDWKKRIDRLKEIEEGVISPFITGKDIMESVSRWQEAIENPFSNFSMFAVPKKELDVILLLIDQILEMATELFGKERSVYVADHVRKLDGILKKYEVSNEMYDEERKIVEDIFEKLGGPTDFETKCAPSDIARALNLYISGRYDDGEIQEDRVGMVSPLYFADAACIKNNGKVHVCMCDVNTTPGGGKNWIWPLTGKAVRECLQESGNPLVKNMIFIMDATPIYNRYFIYCALKNPDVTLSWISRMNDKILAPSPYIKLLTEAAGAEIRPAKRNTITFGSVANVGYGQGRIETYDVEKRPVGTIKEAKMAYALCPMRYVLGYVTEKYPSYKSEFQQQYAINALISAIYSLMENDGVTLDHVYSEVMELFPSMRKAEKRQVRDYLAYDRQEGDFDYESRTECGGSYYTDERLKIYYPNQQVRELVFGRFGKLMTPDGRKDMNLYEVIEATTTEEVRGGKDIARSACVFCPHIDQCRNAAYAVDQESYYE